jgi:hypothetical protein
MWEWMQSDIAQCSKGAYLPRNDECSNARHKEQGPQPRKRSHNAKRGPVDTECLYQVMHGIIDAIEEATTRITDAIHELKYTHTRGKRPREQDSVRGSGKMPRV